MGEANVTEPRRRLEWHKERGFLAFLVDLDTGNTVARVLFREPGCYMAAVNATLTTSTHETMEAAVAWIDAELAGAATGGAEGKEKP